MILLWLLWMLFLSYSFFMHKISTLMLGRIFINNLSMIAMLFITKFDSNKLWYASPLHMIVLASWNIYFIKETAIEKTFTDHPFEMFGADQSTMMFMLHVFAISYSYRYAFVVLFPMYFIINLATVIKIKLDTTIEQTNNKQMVVVMQRITTLALSILFSRFCMDIDSAQQFLKSHFLKNQQKQLTSVFNNHMDGIILCRKRKEQESGDEQISDQEGNLVKQQKGELVFDLCNQAVTKIFGFTPQLSKGKERGILKNSGYELSSTPMFMELKGNFDTGFDMSKFN